MSSSLVPIHGSNTQTTSKIIPDVVYTPAQEDCCGLIGDISRPSLASSRSFHVDEMDQRACVHDRITVLNLLKSCGKEKNIWKVQTIHADLFGKGLIHKDVYIGTSLLSTYAKCGLLHKARDVFEQLPARNVVTWTALIAGYVTQGFGHEALECFRKMQDEGVSPNAITYACILKACGIVGSLEIGERIDAEVRKKGLLEKDIVLGITLVNMYAKCGVLDKAHRVFKEMPVRNVVAWTTLIDGYVMHGRGDEALKCFRQMQDEGICANVVTYMCILKACCIVGSLKIGEDIHDEITKQGLLKKDVGIGTALIDMYCRCGPIEKAQAVFEQLPAHDVVSWTALITGYTDHGLGNKALRCFRQMQDEGIYPNVVTYICVLKACGLTRCLEVGENIDAEVRKSGLLQNNVVLGTTLVDMYFRCGALEKARQVFEQLPVKDVVCWNALIAGYSLNGLNDEALKCFSEMQDRGVCPNEITFICILKACAVVGSLDVGEEIDAKVRHRGLLQRDTVLGNALLGMYAKCVAMEKAQEVFEQLPTRSVISWTSLITGYSQLGQANVALDMYRKMRTENVLPNSVTFIVLLTACSHAGFLEEGENVFDEMCGFYCLTPMLEHYTCMIDLFARAGQFDQAKALLNKVSSSGSVPQFLVYSGCLSQVDDCEALEMNILTISIF